MKLFFQKKTSQNREKEGENLVPKKLEEAKEILAKVKEKHPEFFKNKSIDGKLIDDANKIYESYFEILEMAGIEDPIHKFDKSLI